MKSSVRHTWCFLGVTVALFMALALVLATNRAVTDSVRFVPAEHRFDAPLETAHNYAFQVTLRNGTRQIVTVLGASEFCGEDGCAKLDGFPQVVESGADCQISVLFQAGAPGRFLHEVPIYTNCPGQIEVMLRIVGEVSKQEAAEPPQTIHTPESATGAQFDETAVERR